MLWEPCGPGESNLNLLYTKHGAPPLILIILILIILLMNNNLKIKAYIFILYWPTQYIYNLAYQTD